MHQIFSPLESQLVEQDRKHLEVVVLFVAYHVYHLVYRIIGKALFGSTDVLGHVNRGTIGTEQQFLVKSFGGKVCPYRTVFLAVEDTFFQTFQHFLFPFQIGVRFVINLVEAYSHHLVGLIESGIYPVVHLLPKGTHFGVACFPFAEHFTGFLHQRRLGFGFFLAHSLFHQFGYFGFVVLVEGYVVIAYQVVAFLSR